MEYLYAILLLMGGLGAFLMGANLVSKNIGKLANKKIRDLFNKTSNNKLVGVGIGAASTAIVQSSGLTTIMVVGLVNAGIMTLFQATTVIMGANIGTTITAQIAALQAFDFDKFAIALTCVGALMVMLTKKDKLKTIGYSIAGLGLIFMGLYLMKFSMEEYSESEAVKTFLMHISNPFLLLFIGIVLTALVQSSSAITSILISMAGAGLVIGNGGNAILFLILGSNIGSCVTAIMSSIGASRNAKRAGLIHLMFNTFGSIIFFILLVSWPGFMASTFERWFPNLPSTQIAMFHTAFNVICTMLFLPFTNVFVWLATKLIKDKKEEPSFTTYLDKRFLATPTIALEALVRETIMMLDMAMDSVNTSLTGFIEKDESKNDEVFKLNDQISEVSKGITNYLVETATKHLSFNDEQEVSALHHNNGGVVRVSELADNITKYTVKSVKDNLVFSDSVYVQLKEMYDTLKELAEETKKTVETTNKRYLPKVDELEEKIDNMRKTLISNHIERMNAGTCRPASSSVFINLVSNLERIGDHLSYIAHSIEDYTE